MQRDHSPENREKLRRAGLSMESELQPDEVERLDAIDFDTIGDRTGASLRDEIMRGATGEAVIKSETGEVLAAAKPAPRQGPSAGQQAVEMLRERGAMHYRDLAEALVKEGRVTPKGKTFAQTLSADLSRRNGGDVKRVAPGVYAANDVATTQEITQANTEDDR